MIDESELAEYDPFDLLDEEATRVERFYAALSEDELARPSGCAGWSVRDVLAHMAGSEDYNHACLNDELPRLFEEAGKDGVTDFNSFNDWAVRRRAGRSREELLREFSERDGAFRQELRRRGMDGTVATSIGPYPARLQAWHIAIEFATHGDDVGIPVPAAERARRLDWRARFSRFAVAEANKPVSVERRAGENAVSFEGVTTVLSDEELVAAAVARLPDSSPVNPKLRVALRALA